MNKEKQIEEMAKALMYTVNEKHGCASMRSLAKSLYNAGYRKQAEGKWISVDERLPEESGDYLVHTGNYSTVLHYSQEHKRFNTHDGQDAKFVEEYHIDVLYWMPVPELPEKKGE